MVVQSPLFAQRLSQQRNHCHLHAVGRHHQGRHQEDLVLEPPEPAVLQMVLERGRLTRLALARGPAPKLAAAHHDPRGGARRLRARRLAVPLRRHRTPEPPPASPGGSGVNRADINEPGSKKDYFKKKKKTGLSP